MSLRPRYSLLTLLILTALVAGGVKLWYGPHHVVERVSPDVEDAYTYTRDFFGNRIKYGARARRNYNEGVIYRVLLGYFRQGAHTGQHCFLHVDPEGTIKEVESPPTREQSIVPLLSAQEQVEWRKAIDHERQHIAIMIQRSSHSPQ